MTFVVTGPCIGCKCGSCAEMCPVDAFREGEMMLFIDPTVCVDCDACREQCGRRAIFSEEDLPEIWQDYLPINAQESLDGQVIVEPQQSLGFPIWECNVRGGD